MVTWLYKLPPQGGTCVDWYEVVTCDVHVLVPVFGCNEYKLLIVFCLELSFTLESLGVVV